MKQRAKKVSVGAKVIIESLDHKRILLIKRKYEPDRYTWDAPGGLIEYGETLHQCAVREVKEETGLTVQVNDLITATQVIHLKTTWHRVLIYYKGLLVKGTLKAGDDAAGARWVEKPEVMKMNLRPAFREVYSKLKW